MGILNSAYKKSIVDDIIYSIQSNTNHYYAFISNPLDNANNTTVVTVDDYSSTFEPVWKMLFGKKITEDDIVPVITKKFWEYNTVYSHYDDKVQSIRPKNNFYVISQPTTIGGDYLVYVCVDNANGAPSTVDPGTIIGISETTIQTSDNYKWRYIASTSSTIYNKFSTTNYFPLQTNTLLSSTASSRTGIENVVIVDRGSGYFNYNSGLFMQFVNSSVVQISNGFNRSRSGDFNECDIYFNTGNVKTSEIHTISNYESNTTGCFVYLYTNANTDNYIGGGNTSITTSYSIAPRVVIESDGNIAPKAYCTIDPGTSNSIAKIEMLETGNNVTWANASIVSAFGKGANVYCVVPPPGGFGYNPASEIGIVGVAFSLNFANSESNTILGNSVVYNKFGIIKNPHTLLANTAKGSIYTGNTFNQTLTANLSSPSIIPTTGDHVIGQSSNARGVVVTCNSTTIVMTGDKHFIDGEMIKISSNTFVTNASISTIDIVSRGDVYTKDIYPLYVQNINSVNRSNNQTESFKLIIKI